jgi:hypothetical protein
MGREMIMWILDRLALAPEDLLVIIYDPNFIPAPYWADITANFKVKYVHLPGPTRGAAETVLYGLKGLDAEELKRPTMLCDGDTFYTADVVSRFREIRWARAGLAAPLHARHSPHCNCNCNCNCSRHTALQHALTGPPAASRTTRSSASPTRSPSRCTPT